VTLNRDSSEYTLSNANLKNLRAALIQNPLQTLPLTCFVNVTNAQVHLEADAGSLSLTS
jgi:hypothetical protein